MSVFFRLEIIMWESNDVTTTLRGYVSKNVFLPTAAKQAAVAVNKQSSCRVPCQRFSSFACWRVSYFECLCTCTTSVFVVFRDIKVISDFLKIFRLFYYYSQSNSFVSKVSFFLKKKDFTRYITLSWSQSTTVCRLWTNLKTTLSDHLSSFIHRAPNQKSKCLQFSCGEVHGPFLSFWNRKMIRSTEKIQWSLDSINFQNGLSQQKAIKIYSLSASLKTNSFWKRLVEQIYNKLNTITKRTQWVTLMDIQCCFSHRLPVAFYSLKA